MSGVTQGVTFIHGCLAAPGAAGGPMAEAYVPIGVVPTASMEESSSVYRVKVQFALPDGAEDPGGKRIRAPNAMTSIFVRRSPGLLSR